jgi:hypothetical protein
MRPETMLRPAVRHRLGHLRDTVATHPLADGDVGGSRSSASFAALDARVRDVPELRCLRDVTPTRRGRALHPFGYTRRTIAGDTA